MRVIGIAKWISLYTNKQVYSKQLIDGSLHDISRKEFYKLKRENGW
jgi:hypothetical protein